MVSPQVVEFGTYAVDLRIATISRAEWGRIVALVLAAAASAVVLSFSCSLLVLWCSLRKKSTQLKVYLKWRRELAIANISAALLEYIFTHGQVLSSYHYA